MSYYINNPTNASNIVELWSSKRLPFEPKGWLRDMRDALRSAINRLIVEGDNILSATYQSDSKELCDIENILFYNVGTASFKNASHNGFLLERDFSPVVSPPENLVHYTHYQRYQLMPNNQQPLHWIVGNVLASWDCITIPKLTSDSKPHYFWKLIKECGASVFATESEYHSGYFGLECELLVGQKSFNPVNVIKPMIDGVISAFHCHQGEHLKEVSARLACSLSYSPDHVEALLTDKASAILGNRCLLYPYRNSVQWNPADDKCVVIKLNCKESTDGLNRMSGTLFSVQEVN